MRKEVLKGTRIKGKLFIIVAILALVLSFIVPISNHTSSGIIGQHEIIIGNSVYARGVEDYTCDGIADDVQFQQALDALPSIGGKITFRAGNYVFANTVSRAINNVTIEGIGDASYVSCNNSLPLFSASGQIGWTFSNFRTDAGWIIAGTNTTFINMNNSGIKITTISGVTLIGNSIALNGTVNNIDINELANSIGNAGSKWYSGSGTPSVGIGINGDYYLDDSNGFVYTKSYNIWNYVNSIKGSTGATGTQGIQGNQGAPGYTPIKGVDYFDGINGTNGTNGYTPIKGVDYFDGTQGMQGIQGIKGDTGAQGESGATGLQGEPGVKGDKGDAGVAGSKGDTGGQGLQGIPGVKGDPGDAGPKGDTGNTGAAGTQGIQGIQGTKGDTGSQGTQGSPGEKGDTGSQGTQGLPGYTPIKGVDYFDGTQGIQGIQGVQGEKGDKGDTGSQGIQGIQGNAGPNQVTTSTATNITGLIKGNGASVSASSANVSILEAVTEAFTTALKSSYDAAVTNSHTHSNKSTLDAITEAFTTSLKSSYDNAVTNSHTHSNKSTLDATQEAFTTALKASYDNAVSLAHTQGTDQGLDTGGANATTAAQVKTAVTNSHTHSNISVLNATQESFTTTLKTSYDWLVTNITSAWKTTVDNFVNSKGQASGIAPLDSASKVPTINLGGSGATSSLYLRGDQSWATPPVSAPSPPTGTNYITLQNDFIGTVAADVTPFTATAISTGTAAFQAGQAGHSGIIRYTSSTTANSGYKIVGSQITAFLISGGETAELVIKTPAAFTNTTIRFGYFDTATYVDATDGVYFEIPSTGAIVGKTSSNSVRSTTASSYTASVSTWYRLKLVVNDTATSVTYYIYNSSGGQLWTDSLTANIPTATGRETGFGIIATNSGTTATALMDLDAMLFYDVKSTR